MMEKKLDTLTRKKGRKKKEPQKDALTGFKAARRAAGITQQQLAAKLFVSLKTVRNWEQGLVVPDLGTMKTLCSVLSCDLDFLAGRMEVRTHDVKTLCELTGLTPAAAERLIWFKSIDGEFLKGLSRLIEKERFVTLIDKYSSFISLMAIYRHLEKNEIPHNVEMNYNMENHSITFPIEGAIEFTRESAAAEMDAICRSE